MRRLAALALLLASAAPAIAAPPRRSAPAPATAAQVTAASLSDLQAMLADGRTTSAAATQFYLDRIAAMDRQGPTLRAVIAINPAAIIAAQASDERRRTRRLLGPLDGVPILIKDNIETRDPMPTTAGSLALANNLTSRDAPLVARLRGQGAVILGKTNLSEWANIRSSHSISGWSAVGGLVRNPYALDRTSCGSSSGSGAAVAAGFAPAAIGTETDGSVVCPSAMNGLVGFKPTLGLVSRSRVVPISHSQDTPGPIGTTVRDVAVLLSGIAGSDPADAATVDANSHRGDYARALSPAALRGVRIAVLRPDMPDPLRERFEAELQVLRRAGATLVDVTQPTLTGLDAAEELVLHTELRADLNTYLADTPPTVRTRTLAQVIAFNRQQAATELAYFGQETFIAADATHGLTDPAYGAALATERRLAGREGIDAMLATARATILVTPTYGMPWLSDPVSGDHFDPPSASQLPAVAGYPHLTVPMGLVRGLPVGLSFIGTAWADQAVLNAGYAYEQASHRRVAPAFRASVDAGDGLNGGR